MTTRYWPWQRNVRANRADTRRSARYVSGVAAEFGWWEGEFRSTSAIIADISHGGAAVLARATTPSGGTAYLRAVEGASTGWVEVEILAVRATRDGRSVVHLKFIDGPSYGLFRSAIPATDLDNVRPDVDPEIYGEYRWR